MTSQSAQPAVKDEDAPHPVASAWRPTLREIVESFRAGDFGLTDISSVDPLDPANQQQIKDYIRDFGETLAALPDDTWATSVAQWMGSHWHVVVDLWTEESGGSDLVLSLRVSENDDGSYRVRVGSVHVP